MPVLKLDRIAAKQLLKLQKKDRSMTDRFNITKKLFDSDHLNPSLNFKKHPPPGNFKIRLLGAHDGKRLYMRPSSNHQIFYVWRIKYHDEI